MEAAEVAIAAIHTAFAGVPRGAITLHEAEDIDSYLFNPNSRLLDSEASWEQVPDADIEACTTALCHLDPEGWRYYIPAYMVWALRHYRVSNSIVVDFTIYTFNPYTLDHNLRAHQLVRFGLLDAAQSRAVCRFLRLMAANGDYADGRSATTFLIEYWGKFCEA